MDYRAILQKVQELDSYDLYPGKTELAALKRYRQVCIEYSKEVRDLIRSYQFDTEDEEIYFFKEVKPQLETRVFFFTKLYNIEVTVPPVSIKKQIEHYREERRKLDHYASNSVGFQRYMRDKQTSKDHLYFTRGYKEELAGMDYRYCDMDHDTCTAKGFVQARLLSHDRLHRYLHRKILLLKSGKSDNHKSQTNIRWEGKKVNLVVLMYGLIETRQVNCDIATLSVAFKELFDIEINDTYRAWLDVKS